MPTAFARSTMALRADTFRRSIWVLVLVLALLMALGLWMGLAKVEVYEVSRQARLEVAQQVHPVAPMVPGRVRQVSWSVGQRVEAGQPLVMLEAETEQLKVEEERARLAALPRRIEALLKEIEATQQAWRQETNVAATAVSEAHAEVGGRPRRRVPAAYCSPPTRLGVLRSPESRLTPERRTWRPTLVGNSPTFLRSRIP